MSLPPVYTYPLLIVNLLAAGTASATVPTGFRWIVTDITLTINGTPFVTTNILISAGGVPLMNEGFNPYEKQTWNWHGRCCLEAGEVLGVELLPNGSSPACFGRVTGFQLSSP